MSQCRLQQVNDFVFQFIVMKSSYLHFTSLCIAAVLLSACEEKFVQSIDGSEDGIEFKVEVSNQTEEGATFTITNNGKDRNTWYAFAYDDVNTTPEAAINRKVKELSESDKGISSFLERGSKRIRVADGMNPSTKYVFVVFGLTSEGTVYGKPGHCEFKTEHTPLTFKLEVNSETSSSVEIAVSPSTNTTDKWYCFVTDDMLADAAEIVAKEVSTLSDYEAVLKNGKKRVSFESLKPSVKLRAIATGLDEDGKTFGTPAVLEFRLTPDAVLNENWNVTYDGLTKPEGADKEYRKITNTSSDGERFFIDIISDTNLEALYDNDINAYVKAAVTNLTTRYPTNWNRYVLTQTGSMYYTLRTRRNYFAFAIGIDKAGYFTGKFAVSEKFRIDGKDWSNVYDKWIGKWEVADNVGKGYNITISEDVREDYSYNIVGWNGVTDAPIHGVIDDETGNLILKAWNYGKYNLPTADGTVPVTRMLVGLAGNRYYGLSSDNSDSYDICYCELGSSGTSGKMKGLSITTSNGTSTFSQMFYIGVGEDGSTIYTYGDRSNFPTFPCNMGRSGM